MQEAQVQEGIFDDKFSMRTNVHFIYYYFIYFKDAHPVFPVQQQIIKVANNVE